MLCALVTAAAAAAVPSTMTAATKSILGCGAPFTCIKTGTKDTPTPKAGQVLIEVKGSSVNPVDVDMVRISPKLGLDVSGVIAAVGSGVTRLKVGDEVWADNGVTGAMAQYAVYTEKQTGLKPTNLPFTDAGTIPLVALTSLGCLQMSKVDLKNKTVVITSGSGGTGYTGVQIAKALGASQVITAASGDGIDFVKGVGADVVVDYKVQAVVDSLADDSVDVVYDNYGAKGTACKALKKIRSGGAYVVLPGGNGGAECSQKKAGVAQYNFGMLDSSDHANLDILKGFFEAGKMKAHVQQAFPLADAAKAFALESSGQVVGKVAVTVNQ